MLKSVLIFLTVGYALSVVGVLAGPPAGISPQRSDFNHLANNRRTGFTPAEFKPPYYLAWTHRFVHKPRPAWREPAWETQRIDMDYAYPIAADAETVYVASSSDHAVHAMDLKSGQLRWRFFTEGPVRLAPTVYRGKVYFSSDDGFVYCLDGMTGALMWKYRPHIPDQRLIGNEQMINRWPARSGVLVEDDRAYTTFGMWSTEGVMIACLDAQTGKVIWQNDSSGTRYMTQPHYEAMGGVSPQGLLALCGDVLVVPCGRAAPAFFDTETGKLLYNEAEGLFPGGAWTMTFGDLAFTPCEFLKKPNHLAPEALEAKISQEASLVALEARTGKEVFHLHGALRGVIDDNGQMSLVGPKGLVRVALEDVLRSAPGGYQAKRGNSAGHFVEVDEHKQWETPVKQVYELLQAGSTLIAGGRNTLTCYNSNDGSQLWQMQLKGDVRELLIAGRSLLVSTSQGEIHCLGTRHWGDVNSVCPAVRQITPDAATQKRVASILGSNNIDDGYGLVLGDVQVDYLVSLVHQSNLIWHWATESRDLQAIRAQLADAGLYGVHIAIHDISLGSLPYADYSVNLLVWEIQSTDDLLRTTALEIYRVLRPYGGTAVISCCDEFRPAVEQWLASGDLPELKRQNIAEGILIERGPLPGAGAWTHQYADSGKSGSSDDRLVRLPLKVLWFGSLGPADIVSRHYRTPAPLAINGRMFVPGRDYLHAVDAYNGRILWERKLPGVGRWPAPYRGGCIAADEEAVYVLDEKVCLRLDPQTGETQSTFKPPAKANSDAQTSADEDSIWEYLAVSGRVIVGTLGQPNIRRSWWSMAHPANQLLFVLDKATGEPLWSYEAKSAIDSSAIAVRGQRLFLIDGLAAAEVFSRSPRRGETSTRQSSKPRFSLPGASHRRVLKALDLSTGAIVWETTEIGPRQNSLCVDDGVVLATTPVWHGLRAKQEGPGVSAFAAEDGRRLWTREKTAPPPVIVNAVVYLPEACDLHTGRPVLRKDPLTGLEMPYSASVTGGCAQMAGCENALMKRSGSMGFFDLSGRSGVYHFPNMRASCWVNMIPACGLVLVPEGSSSCPCAYNYKASVAMMPADRHNHWGLYTNSPRPKTQRIEAMQLNFGAPGDKQGAGGVKDIWFAYPRPSTVGPRGAGGMGNVPYDRLPSVTVDSESAMMPILHNPDWTTIEGVNKTWLYTCGLAGPLKLRVQVAPDGSPTCQYRVTLYFYELRDAVDTGTFDVILQGKKRLVDLRIARQANGRRRPLVEQFTVNVAEDLALELVARSDSPPIINAMRIQQMP